MFEAILLLVLLAAWAAVLLPSVLRSRTQSAHLTIGGFANSMQALRRHADGRELMVPGQPDRIVHAQARSVDAPPLRPRVAPVLDRRRAWFTRLVVATVASLLLAVVVGGAVWLLFVATALVAGGYTALLRTLKVQRDESRRVVHHVEDHAPEWGRHEGERGWADDRYDDRYVGRGHEWGDEQEIDIRDTWQDEVWDRQPVAVGGGAAYHRAEQEPWQPQSGVRIKRF